MWENEIFPKGVRNSVSRRGPKDVSFPDLGQEKVNKNFKGVGPANAYYNLTTYGRPFN